MTKQLIMVDESVCTETLAYMADIKIDTVDLDNYENITQLKKIVL